MVADTLKSASVTALDTVPTFVPDTGEGAPGMRKSISDYVIPTTAGLADTGSKYNMVRVPTTAKIKAMTLSTDGAISSAGLTLDVGAYYSDGPSNGATDGTNPSLAGTVISASAFAAIAVAQSNLTHFDVLTAFKPSKRNSPLWKALGLASDPGGFIDVVIGVHAASSGGTASHELGIDVDYVM